MVQQVWYDLPNHYPRIECDAFVVMPNHVHCIIVVVDAIVGAGFKLAPTRHGLPEIIRGFKTFSARRINDLRKSPGIPIWQRNYYEHIIRAEAIAFVNTFPITRCNGRPIAKTPRGP